MVDLVQTVCCMCGDVGFPDKLFRCNKCRHRFQHSYCSNYYYGELADPIEVCDWCQSELEKNVSTRNNNNNYATNSRWSSKKSSAGNGVGRSQYSSGEKIKQNDGRVEVNSSANSDHKGKSPTGTPSPRPTNRRYKLLKDVMC